MISLLLAVVLSFGADDSKLAYDAAAGLVEKYTPRDSGTYGSKRAAMYILDSVSSLGPNARIDTFVADTPKGRRAFTNVESSFVSHPDNEWVVFISHFDTKTGVSCPGANDGASTSGLMVALAANLFKNRPEKTNILLVWTDGEECFDAYSHNDGLWGSRHVAQKLKSSNAKVRAVVCLDMLGDRDLTISIPENCHPGFKNGVLKIAKAKGLGNRIVSSGDIVYDDHLPFMQAGYKALALIDFEYGSAPGLNDYWHTPKDTMDKISPDSLLLAGRLASWIISGLDR